MRKQEPPKAEWLSEVPCTSKEKSPWKGRDLDKKTIFSLKFSTDENLRMKCLSIFRFGFDYIHRVIIIIMPFNVVGGLVSP